MQIPKYKLPYSDEDIKYVQENISDVLKLGYLTDGGEYVKEFEEHWSDIVGVDYSIAVNSCTTALELILKCIEVENHSVIVPTYTFFATPLSVHNSGGTVIYSDVSRDTMSIGLEDIKRNLQEDTKAVMIVHVGGIVSDELEKIRYFCDDRGIYLIEDAACAAGGYFNGKHVGSFGHASAFSFHHSKVLTTGEGGMITTDSVSFDKKIREMRAIGLNREINNWEVFQIGNNYKMHEITAVLGNLHCKKANDIFAERQRVADFYDKNINFNSRLKKLAIPSETKSANYKYVTIAQSRQFKNHFINEMKDSYDIHLPPTTYEYLCHEQKINSKISCIFDKSFNNARYLMEHNICLPMYCGLQKEELHYIADCVNKLL